MYTKGMVEAFLDLKAKHIHELFDHNGLTLLTQLITIFVTKINKS